ncbi:hypothetical protein OQA88_9237 [Cercophora sp. LCS_1]
MTEVGPADRATLLRLKRVQSSSIVISRKRKLRELFAVATERDAIPNHDLSNPDASPTAPAEAKFLAECDLNAGQKFDESAIPDVCADLFDVLIHKFAAETSSFAEKQLHAAPKQGLEISHLSQTPNNGTAGLAHPHSDLQVTNGFSQKATPVQATPAAHGSPHGHADQMKNLVGQNGVGTNTAQTLGRSNAKPFALQAINDKPGDGLDLDRSPQTETLSLTPVAKDSKAAPSTPPNHNTSTPVPLAHVDQDLAPTKPGVDPATESQHAEGARDVDVSSPESTTAQSTLTTAIHEGSADTSPDNEGSQYHGRPDEEVEEKAGGSRTTQGEGRYDANRLEAVEAPAVATGLGLVSISPTVSGVEAQLLQETAAAQLAQTTTTTRDGQSLGVAEDRAPAPLPSEDIVMQDETANTNATDQQPRDISFTSSATPLPPKAGRIIKSEELTESMEIDSVLPTALPGRSAVDARVDNIPEAYAASQAQKPQDLPVPSTTPSVGTTADVESSRGETKIGDRVTEPVTASQPTPPSEQDKEEDGSAKILSAPQLRLFTNNIQDKRRKSVPTVIFGKQHKTPRTKDDTALVASQQQNHIPTEDYFTPLFIEGFTRQSSWMKPIEKLLNQAHKTVSTSDQYLSILDHQTCKILRRVYHLQGHNKWSLRQPVRCPEPTRPPSHWDVLLQEMKWMRTDFREERKWKRAVARNLAYACKTWVESDAAQRAILQVNAIIPPPRPAADPLSVADEALPDLIHSDSPMGDDEELPEAPVQFIAPSIIFALQDDEVIFSLQPSKTADELLANLPLYGAPLRVPKSDHVGPEYSPDAKWRRPALPLSKYVEGEMVLAHHPPPRKRSRYQYHDEGSDDDGEVVFGAQPDSGTASRPEMGNVGLWDPEMRPILDRIHLSHQFRPPSEFPMPPLSFYESRTASQWTWAEDDQLKSLVREYSYNWSLIASIVSTQSLFASGAERRTPWECFERWVSLEGLPNDFGKTPYFKTYQGRIDAAQKTIAQQNTAAQQQVGPNGAVTPVPRRRPTTTVRVERRRNQKHLALIDAMRKLAKKREAATQKQQHNANLATMRKANEAPRQQQVPNKTPSDYSHMRHERDQQLAEKMAQYARRNEAIKLESLKLRATQVPGVHAGQVAGTPGAVTNPQLAAQLAAATGMNGARANMAAAQLAVPQQNRAQVRPPMQAPAGATPGAVQAAQLSTANGLVAPLPMNNIQLQAMAAQQRVAAGLAAGMPAQPPQADLNLVMEARRIQESQRALQQQVVQQQQQQQHQQHQQVPNQVQQVNNLLQHQRPAQHAQIAHMNVTQGSPPPMRNVITGVNQGTFMSNAQAMVAQFGSNGLGLSPGSGLTMPNVPAGSPRGPGIPPQQMPAIASRLKEIEAYVKNKNPAMPGEQVRQIAMEQLGRLIVQQQAQAMSAATGVGVGQQQQQQQLMNGLANGMTNGMANGMVNSMANGMAQSPHQYAQLLRAQQQQQAAAAAAAAAGQHQRQASGSATPVPGK